MKKIFLTLIPLLLVGCASVKPTITPSGRNGYHLSCFSQQQCFVKAGEVCPHGYDMLSGQERTSRMTFDGGQTYTPVTTVDMFIECY